MPGLGGFSVDDDGFLLGFGLRGRVAQQFELEGAVNYTDYSDSGDDTSLGAAARWFFTDQFSAFAEGEFGDDVTSYGIGMRWNFGGNSGRPSRGAAEVGWSRPAAQRSRLTGTRRARCGALASRPARPPARQR